MNFNDLVRDISRRLGSYGISLNQWEDGYTCEEAEEVLESIQLCLRAYMVEGELAMVWEGLDEYGSFPTGDSGVWILSNLSDGYVGAPITTPLIENDALEGFLKDVINFREGTLILKPVSFDRFSNFNMIRTH